MKKTNDNISSLNIEIWEFISVCFVLFFIFWVIGIVEIPYLKNVTPKEKPLNVSVSYQKPIVARFPLRVGPNEWMVTKFVDGEIVCYVMPGGRFDCVNMVK
jgi:hypothetical protein